MQNATKNKLTKLVVTGAVLTSALGLSFGANASAATSSTQATSSSQVYTSDVVYLPDKNVVLTAQDRAMLKSITGEDYSATKARDKFYISQYFTKSQAAKIADRSSKWSNVSQVVSGINIILGSKPLGVGMYFTSTGIANSTKIFKTAKAKGKGVQISYTYTITRTNYGTMSNIKIVYK